jgi:hypothetical protein
MAGIGGNDAGINGTIRVWCIILWIPWKMERVIAAV